MYSVTIPTKLVGQEFKTEMPKYQIRVIKENENDKISNDTFWKSNQYEGEDAIGQRLDLTSLLDKPTGYLQGKLSSTGDVDYYKFNMWQYRGLNMVDKYNRDVAVTLDHVPTGCEYELFLYDENGNQVGIGKDNGNGGVSVTVPNWSVNNRYYTVKVQAKDGSPVSEEYYHLSFQTKEATKNQGAYQQRQEMSSYYRDFRQKLYEGGDATQEKEALQAIREKYDSYYAEQLEKLHQEQAEEYLKANPDVKSDDMEHSLDSLLNKLAAGEELSEAEKSYLNIFANAKELDLASAKCELNISESEAEMRIGNVDGYTYNIQFQKTKQMNNDFQKSVAEAENGKVSKEDMTLEEYKTYFNEKMDGLYTHPSQKNMNWVIDITDDAYKRMQTDPAYEQKILDALATNKAVNFGNNIPVIAYTHVDDTWEGCYGYTKGMKENKDLGVSSGKKDKSDKKKTEKEDDKKALAEYLEKRRQEQEFLQEMRTKEYFEHKEQQAYWNKRQSAAASYEANIMTEE